METRITTGTVMALACCAALAVAAQQPRPGAGAGAGTPPAPRPNVVGANIDSKESSTATVTGCVQPGAGPKTFVLAESPSALAPPGTTTATTRDRGTRYELLSDGTLDLAKLVGRQVEASGTVSKPAVSSDQSKSTTRSDVLPTFTAKSLRETGASC